MHSNWHYALLAIVLAFLSWYYVSGREQVETWVDIPVEFTAMPEDMTVLDGLKSRISVRLRGSKGMIRNFDAKGMVYSLSLKGLQPGVNVIPFKTDALPVTKAFEVMEINPSRLNLTVDQLVAKTVAVRPGWAGQVDEDRRFVGIRAAPAEVRIKGPKAVLEDMETVGTQPLAVTEADGLLVTGEVPVVLPDNVEANPEQVKVTLEFAYLTKEEIIEVPLSARAWQADIELVDKVALLTLSVPLPLERQDDWQDGVRAMVSVPRDVFGALELPYEIQVPDGVEVLNRDPEKVRVVARPQGPVPSENATQGGAGNGTGL